MTNKCESEVNVTLYSNEENKTAKILFNEESLTIDRNDAKNGVALKPSDNTNYVCYRKDNKIAIKCTVIPLIECDKLVVSFNMKHSYYGMSADLQAAPVLQYLTQQIQVDFGSFKSSVIPRPKYIDECLSVATPAAQ